jgi:hypothetical protein
VVVVKVHGYKVQKTWMSEQRCRLDNHTSELKSIFCDTIAGVEYYHALFESMALSPFRSRGGMHGNLLNELFPR